MPHWQIVAGVTAYHKLHMCVFGCALYLVCVGAESCWCTCRFCWLSGSWLAQLIGCPFDS